MNGYNHMSATGTVNLLASFYSHQSRKNLFMHIYIYKHLYWTIIEYSWDDANFIYLFLNRKFEH